MNALAHECAMRIHCASPKPGAWPSLFTTMAELVYDKLNEMCVVPPLAFVGNKLWIFAKKISPNKSSGPADFEYLLTMKDN